VRDCDSEAGEKSLAQGFHKRLPWTHRVDGEVLKSYGLVASGQWRDVSLVWLEAIPMAELESHVGGEKDRFTINGPSLLLDPRRALALSLVVHELATNATKYGGTK
jgi:hypothetical protein